MKIWLLEKVDNGEWGWGEYYGFLIRAESEERAREIAEEESRSVWDTRPPRWTDPAQASCVELMEDGDEGVILSDYFAD